MTHHDKARKLVERLRGLEVCYLYAEEAADLITAQAEENRRLREALKKIASTGRCEFAEVRAVLRSTEASHD